MSPKKQHEFMDKRQQCLELIQQSSPKGGITAVELSEKLGCHRTTIYDQLNALYNRGLIESDQGKWRVSSTAQRVQPLEKEIIIKLPLPKKELNRAVLIESTSKLFDDDPDSPVRILRDKLEETRTIRIIGRNVDQLDLQKVSELVKQATENSYKAKFKNLFTKPKKAKSNAEKSADKKSVRE
jgi:hypothetical protein